MNAPRPAPSCSQALNMQNWCATEPWRPSSDQLVHVYLAAKRTVIDSGYVGEIARDRQVSVL
jgi:hypothetical protein